MSGVPVSPLTEQLVANGYGPWLERRPNGDPQEFFGFSALRSTVYLATEMHPDRTFDHVPVDVRLILGSDMTTAPTTVDRQLQEQLGERANLFGGLIKVLFAKANRGSIVVGDNPDLMELLHRYDEVRELDPTVPLTVIAAHGGNDYGQHDLQIREGVLIGSNDLLRGITRDLQAHSSLSSGFPVLLMSCNKPDEGYESATVNAPDLHLLRFSGELGVWQRYEPLWQRAEIVEAHHE